MRRDRELIYRLLVKLEEWPSQPGDMFLFSGHEPELAIEAYSGEQIEYHLGILKAEGYIDSPGSQPMQGVTFRSLTPAGHDLVDQYREALELQAAERDVEEKRNWIPAAEAAALLKPVFKSEYLAQMTICKRAHAGLIRARAERFIANGKSRNIPEIPKGFWWAEGNAALHQTWATGDFDTWVDRDELHLEAFGVSFFRADIEKMIPADQIAKPEAIEMPAVTARPAQTVKQKQRRVEQLQNCIKELKSFDIQSVKSRAPPEAKALENSIDEALSAAFGHGTIEYERYKSATQLDQGPLYTPSVVAMAAAPRGSRPDVSAMQAQEAQKYLSEGRRKSIVLLQQAIRAIELEIADQALESDPAEKPSSPIASVGGRPAADWWDDLWVEICRQLFVGDLKPTKQRDIETAMLQWLSDRGESPSTSTIRPRARKLWTAIMREGEN